MNDYTVTPYMPDDIYIEKDSPGQPKETIWLKEALDDMVRFVESVLCKDNADDVYEAAVILEGMAFDLRVVYNAWRKNNFEK